MTLAPDQALQEWFLRMVVLPEADEQALAEGLAAVQPSQTLTPQERVFIYREMYALRMVDALSADFPCLEYAMGEQAFASFVLHDYLLRYPSRSYTLNHLGRHMARALETSALPHAEALADLAELEWMICEALDMPSADASTAVPLTAEHAATLDVLRVTFIPALSLRRFAYNVVQYHAALEAGEEPLPTVLEQPAETFAIVARPVDEVVVRACDRIEYLLLVALLRGATIGEALDTVATTGALSDDVMAASVQHAVEQWIHDGLIHRVVV